MLAHTATQTTFIGEGPLRGWQMANAGGSGCEPEISPSIRLWHFLVASLAQPGCECLCVCVCVHLVKIMLHQVFGLVLDIP